MDPDAKVQVATLGTALYYTTEENPDTKKFDFIGTKEGTYPGKAELEAILIGTEEAPSKYKRIYGLASTPDFGGQPNTIDTTTLDNTKAETSVLGLQPAAEVTYEINMMDFNSVPDDAVHNLRSVKAMADDKKEAHWVLYKNSGVIIEYNAVTNISYTADAQQDIEKFSIYHDIKSDISVSLPAAK